VDTYLPVLTTLRKRGLIMLLLFLYFLLLTLYQGEFRKSLLDLDLLKYGMERDDYIKNTPYKELIVTCLDLVENEYRYTAGGKIVAHNNERSFILGIADYLGIDRVSGISSPHGTFDIHHLSNVRISNG
jgi:hypothetical protein